MNLPLPFRSIFIASPMILIGLLALVALSAVFWTRAVNPTAAPPTLPQRTELPLAFFPNEGQAEPEARYQARALGGMITFTANELIFSLPEQAANPLLNLHPGRNPDRPAISYAAVRMQFENANAEPKLIALAPLPGRVNYFVGNDPANWRRELPTYNELIYEQLYDGVDLHFSGAEGRLKSAYHVAPYVDPADIRWRYQGAAGVEVDPDSGDLLVYLPNGGYFSEDAPIAWQDVDGRRHPIPIHYAVAADGGIGFVLPEGYDPAYPLVLDPTLSYSTFLGGNSADYGYAIAVDDEGYVYVAGVTGSADFPLVNPFQSQMNPFGLAFVSKLTPEGDSLVYSTFLGGSNTDVAWGIAIDAEGYAYITGETWSQDFPTQNPIQEHNAGLQDDAFVTKLSPSGSELIYSTYLGGTTSDQGLGIALDDAGNVYVVGTTLSSTFPLKNPLQTYPNSFSGFVTKINAAGSALVYSTYLGGSSNGDYANSIVVDGLGNAYVVGYTTSTDFPTANPFQANNNGFGDVFVSKLNPSGSALVWSTYLGGSLNDWADGVALDGAGNVYVSGWTDSTNFPTVNAFQPENAGWEDAFVTKFDASGTFLHYSTYLGGSLPDGDYRTVIAVDEAGHAYLAGNTLSEDFPVVNAIQPVHGSPDYNDVFVTKFSLDGTELIYSTFIGGGGGWFTNSEEHAFGIAVDGQGGVYVTGETISANFPTTDGALQTTIGGNYDAFVFKIEMSPDNPTPTSTPASPTATNTPVATATQPGRTTPTPGATATPTTTPVTSVTPTATPTQTNRTTPTPTTTAPTSTPPRIASN